MVSDFDLESYLGTWHEIARMDFFWEKNLKNVTATYSMREDGLIRVDNQGFDTQKNKLKQSIGKANFVGEATEGALKVSFFGPFYAGYNVVMLDGGYQAALVFGANLDYMWILSREKTLPDPIKVKYLDYAKRSGYDIDKLVWTEQD